MLYVVDTFNKSIEELNQDRTQEVKTVSYETSENQSTPAQDRRTVAPKVSKQPVCKAKPVGWLTDD